MCITDHHDMALAVKVALNPNTTNQPNFLLLVILWYVQRPSQKVIKGNNGYFLALLCLTLYHTIPTYGKRIICCLPAFYPFPTMFSTLPKTNLKFSATFNLWSTAFSLNESENLLFGKKLTLSSIYTHFNTLNKASLTKTLWKKVKLLKISNFTFFHNVFYAICILKSFNSHISVGVYSFFEFGMVSKWCIGEWVNQFTYVQIETVCRQLSKKHCWLKEKKCWLLSFPSFHTVFISGLFQIA